jgi:hypothetical protein
VDGAAVVTAEGELAYWKALAMERGAALEALHERLRSAMAMAPDSVIVDLADAIQGRLTGWTREPARMEPFAELRASDVLTELDDLWKRVAADAER